MATTTYRLGLSVFPDASNTGVPVGTSLTGSGSVVSSSNGQTIQALDISGSVDITHDNVTLKNCRITSNDSFVVTIVSGATGCTIQDCEINCSNGNNTGIKAESSGWLILRCNVHHCENGIDTVGSSNGVIRRCYIHDMDAANNAAAHYDCLQNDGDISNLLIDNCTLDNQKDDTSCVMIDNDWAPVSGVIVQDCLMLGGGSYTVYSDAHFSADPITGVQFLRNRMQAGGFGYASIVGNTITQSGNVDHDTGTPITL